MALRVRPKQPRANPHHQSLLRAKRMPNPILGSLSNLAGMSGGTPPGSGGGAGGGGQGGGQDAAPPWESDPILQQIRSLQAANIASADAQSQAARQQSLISYGYSPELDALYGDAGTSGAAKANPFSILQNLMEGHTARQKNLNESYNKANLFYSSARGQGLANEGKQYLGEQASASARERSLLSDISNANLAAHQNAQGALTQATQDAYQRYLDTQLRYGLGDAAGAGKPRTQGARPVQRRASPFGRPGSLR